MEKRFEVTLQNDIKTNVWFTTDNNEMNEKILSLSPSYVIVTDENSFQYSPDKERTVVLKSGEENKNWEGIEKILTFALSRSMARDGVFVAIKGFNVNGHDYIAQAVQKGVKAVVVQDGEKIAIFSTGAIFEEVNEACCLLKEQGINPIIYTFPTVKPIDKEIILECASKFDLIATCEEHNYIGGFGSAVAEVLAELPQHAKLLRVGLHDEYSIRVGNQHYLREQYGLDGKSIAGQIIKAL